MISIDDNMNWDEVLISRYQWKFQRGNLLKYVILTKDGNAPYLIQFLIYKTKLYINQQFFTFDSCFKMSTDPALNRSKSILDWKV